MSKIVIFGDICPTKDTQAAFESGDRHAIFGEILPAIEGADLVIGNLECAITDSPRPIRKAGPVLYSSSRSLDCLKDFDALSLANNHIRDCGDEGVMTAMSSCNRRGIKTFGSGANIQEARKPLVLEVDNLKIGIISFAEQEFNVATDSRPGACYLDLYDDFDRIRELRKNVDYLIILYHGGIEYFEYPTPELKRKCRKMAKCGADLISCQHSHCIGTIEQYGDSTIVYGQGNSVFGYRPNNTSWNRGLMLEVDLSKDKLLNITSESHSQNSNVHASVTYRPFIASQSGLKWMRSDQVKKLEKELSDRAVASEEMIDQEWSKFCINIGKIHLPLLLGWPRILIALNRRLNNALIKLLFSRKASNNTHNLIRCEAHKEVIDKLLSQADFK